jgi:hypothetical protein
MKAAIRTIIFTFIALYLTQYIVGAFVFDGNYVQTLMLVLFGLSFLFFFLRPVLKIISLPSDGIGFLFMLFILTLGMLYILPAFLGTFKIHSAHLPSLILFGFVLPSKSLTALWAGVFSALMIAVLYNFFDWLCSKR